MFSYSPFHSSPFSKPDAISAASNVDVNLLDVLANFYVVCPKLQKREDDEHKRLLFYYPPEETSQRKAEITGMAAAMVDFTSELIRIENSGHVKRRSHRFVRSSKSTGVFLPVEDDFIIGATLNRDLCKSKSFYPHPATLLRTVENLYDVYKLFYGPFKPSVDLDDTSAKDLALKLDTFFSSYLQTTKLSAIPIIDYLDGICFMPLKPKLLLEIQCFVEQCAETCPELRLTMFLFQSRLAQYSIDKNTLRPLYRFMVDHLIPHALAEELQPEVVLLNSGGRFIRARFDFATQDASYPRVHLMNHENGKLEVFHLIAYRSLNATLCILIPDGVDPGGPLTKLRQILEPKMSTLASEMGETITELSRPLITGVPFHFIYHNYDSLSFRTSLKQMQQQPDSNGNTIIFTPEISCAIYEAFDKFIEQTDESIHTALKVGGDLWVGFKRSNQRIIVVFLPNAANSTLQDFHGYFDSILSTHFEHVYFN
ncbi:hypothetical protein M3Y94_00080200 [Aphelenchoides besseyi]|nr:hypothetical protein M3Y94_00080200 [Aphelenchoides besseyi]KAI6237793.1 Degt-1 [Aphelenchoides besseyi]